MVQHLVVVPWFCVTFFFLRYVRAYDVTLQAEGGIPLPDPLDNVKHPLDTSDIIQETSSKRHQDNKVRLCVRERERVKREGKRCAYVA